MVNCSENKYNRNDFLFFTYKDKNGVIRPGSLECYIKKNDKYYNGMFWTHKNEAWKVDNFNTAMRIAVNLEASVEFNNCSYKTSKYYSEFIYYTDHEWKYRGHGICP